MKLSLLFVLIAGAVPVFGQWVVNDPINTAVNTAIKGNQIAQHVEVMRQWAEELERLNRQIRQVEDLLAVQRLIRNVMGDPARAGDRVVRRTLDGTAFAKTYGETMDSARRLADAMDSLRQTANGIYRALDDRTSLGAPFGRQSLDYRRHAAVERQADNMENVFATTDAEMATVQADLAAAVRDLRDAPTQAETDKIAATVAALNGRLATLAARRSEETNKLLAAHIRNENQAEKERRDLWEKEAVEERQSLSIANTWQESLRLSRTLYTRP